MTEERKIATHEEVLVMLSDKARQGETGAMIALERALRVRQREKDDDDFKAELERLAGRLEVRAYPDEAPSPAFSCDIARAVSPSAGNPYEEAARASPALAGAVPGLRPPSARIPRSDPSIAEDCDRLFHRCCLPHWITSKTP